MYLNKSQIRALKVALDIMDIMQIYGEDTEEIRKSKEILEKLKTKSEQKLKT